MKKILALLLAMIMIGSLTACGKREKVEDFGGTWKVDCIEYEGAKFTLDEWNDIENEDLSDFYIVFKDGGKAYFYAEGYGDLVDWLYSNGNIMIGDEKCPIVDGMICFGYYSDVKIYFKKASDSQEIPKEKDENDDANNEYLTDENDILNDDMILSQPETDSTGGSLEWRQFLNDYEAWVDDYIAIVKKYKDNPTDMSILSDYSRMVSEMTDWTERADEIELELQNTSEALEYSAELLRIAGKLAEVAY